MYQYQHKVSGKQWLLLTVNINNVKQIFQKYKPFIENISNNIPVSQTYTFAENIYNVNQISQKHWLCNRNIYYKKKHISEKVASD